MVFPLLPLFLVGPLGAPVVAVGFMEGLAETVSAALRLGGGHASDRTGRRKPFVVAGYAASGLAKPLYALASVWPHVVAARFLDRVGKGVRTAPRDALLADSSDARRYGATFGFHRAMDTLGAVGGSAAALAVVVLAAGQTPFQSVFVLAAVPALAAVLVATLVREVPGTPRAPLRLRGALAALPRPLRLVLAASGLFAVARVSDAFLLVRAHELGAGLAEALALYVLLNIVFAATAIPAGRLADRVGRLTVLLASFLVFAVVASGFALATRETLPVWFAAAGLFLGLSDGVARAAVSELSPAGLRGTALGAHSAVLAFAALPAGTALGAVWQLLGAPVAFALAAAVALASAVVLAWARREAQKGISGVPA